MSDRIQEAAEVLAGVTNRGMRRPGTVGDDMLSRGKDLPLATAEDFREEAQALADAGLLATEVEYQVVGETADGHGGVEDWVDAEFSGDMTAARERAAHHNKRPGEHAYVERRHVTGWVAVPDE